MAGWALPRSCMPQPWCIIAPLPRLGAGDPTQLLESAGHLQILQEGQVLQIKPAGVPDSGHYTCVATNPLGADDKDFSVHVQGEPWVSWSGGGSRGEGSLWGSPMGSGWRGVCVCWIMCVSPALAAPGGDVPLPTAHSSLSPQCHPCSSTS